jgi:hypothetical protein
MPAGADQPVLPPEFAGMLSRVLAPGEADAAAEVIQEALTLDDRGLAAFLEAVAARMEQPDGLAVTAAELRALLVAVPDA